VALEVAIGTVVLVIVNFGPGLFELLLTALDDVGAGTASVLLLTTLPEIIPLLWNTLGLLLVLRLGPCPNPVVLISLLDLILGAQITA